MTCEGVGAQADRPAHYVPKALHEAGVAIVPVPVYYPDVDKILGQKVIRKLQDIPHPVDILDVFRRSEDLPPHLDDILSIKPKVYLMLKYSGKCAESCMRGLRPV